MDFDPWVTFFFLLTIFILDSHVAKTGDIKDFVITEESGIAKGIRRIVAVTGHEAHEVTRLAYSLDEKLNQLESARGKEKDAGLKAFSVVRIFLLFDPTKDLISWLIRRNSVKQIFLCSKRPN